MTTPEKQTGRQHLREGLRLLRLAYQRPRKPDHPYEVADMATISVRELHTIERELHGLWWGQARYGYLKSELRRRGLSELRDLVFLCTRRLIEVCLRRRREDKPEVQVVPLFISDEPLKSEAASIVKPNVANNRIAADREAGCCNSG